MIERIVVRNWQSLHKLDLELGRFTVIVGPSRSGKSALMRAFKAVASNVRGSGPITQGAKSAAITVHTGEHVITLERSATSGLYRVVDSEGNEDTYTKLNGSVPAQITAALRISPVPTNGFSINFANQLDRPYLLDLGGSAVAREFGELTNVNRIFAAVAEANKLKNRFAATLKTREADLVRTREKAETFRTLPAKVAACTEAEAALARAVALSEQADDLQTAAARLAEAEQVLEHHTALPEVPDPAPMLAAKANLDDFLALLTQWRTASDQITAAATASQAAADEEARLEAELHDLLVGAGACPTCGQTVS